jgi:hypothetical protein
MSWVGGLRGRQFYDPSIVVTLARGKSPDRQHDPAAAVRHADTFAPHLQQTGPGAVRVLRRGKGEYAQRGVRPPPAGPPRSRVDQNEHRLHLDAPAGRAEGYQVVRHSAGRGQARRRPSDSIGSAGSSDACSRGRIRRNQARHQRRDQHRTVAGRRRRRCLTVHDG